MRCQWGPTWETMRPWIAARRFKEFSYLDSQLRDHFPKYNSQFLPLPEKKLIGHLDTDVVKGRQIALELYMVRLVETMPDALASNYVNVFLNMKNRVSVICAKIDQEERINAARSGEEYESSIPVQFQRPVPEGSGAQRRASKKLVSPGQTGELSADTSNCNNPVAPIAVKFSEDEDRKIRAINVLVRLRVTSFHLCEAFVPSAFSVLTVVLC